jgi:hypothetical protein
MSKSLYGREEIISSTGNDYFLNFISKGYDVTQNGDLVILDKPGYIEYQGTGTPHGTTYTLIRMFPRYFLRWHIKRRIIQRNHTNSSTTHRKIKFLF